SYDDGHSHGTHCAGIIGARNNFIGVVGVAPLCNLYAVKVLSDSGSGYSSWVIAGMDWCIQNNIQVASMSLGSPSAPSVAYANAVRR
ncbi:MAG: S8 family serine peptidase, partial [Gammaproteobacteria bacterium]|nr:S8 family serine peptidase [Gammaproteobacteria bacterium]NIR93270.1 S8 family serine peptidase [Gammaproteobacteria bacterium]NIW44918.1 S8 family serine peptidase [Gammaproteobacteria bacterium]NIX56074.1 S8 family serine peptidase [candidate division Zixibacteria bacterium]